MIGSVTPAGRQRENLPSPNPKIGTGSGLVDLGRTLCPMEQRVSIVTLGVKDIRRARRFYEELGWRGQEVEETVFFQAGGQAVILGSATSLPLMPASPTTTGALSGGWSSPTT